jgi:dTDP-4-dehydrorhamnose 3,5-epimerase
MKDFTHEDIHSVVRQKVFVQNYKEKKMIDGVKTVEVKRYAGEDGTFEDIMRINNEGYLEFFPEFQVRQINRSKLLAGVIKAWHLHYKQEDIWYVPPDDHMILGLWDTREVSPTRDLTMKIVMGNETSRLVFIPRGVAHGVVNVAGTAGNIYYFVNNQYKIEDPDEHRLPWDQLGKGFWEVEKG